MCLPPFRPACFVAISQQGGPSQRGKTLKVRGTNLGRFTVPEVIVLEGVNFHTNSSLLTEDSGLILDSVVETLRTHDGLTVEVAGYTDSDGEAEYNQWLSQCRANAVMSYLDDHGIDASSLSANGYGESQPFADNDTPEGKAQNRRVVLHLK